MNIDTKKEMDAIDVFRFVLKNRRPIIWATLFGAIVSLVVSLVLTPSYKATAVIFPTLVNTISRTVLHDENTFQRDHLQFGEEEQVEQTLQVLKSRIIRDSVRLKFNLLEHYEIDPEDKHAVYHFKKTYENAVNFKPTEYLSIKITVEDKDKELAANMANYIVDLLDKTKQHLVKDRAAKALSIAKREYLAKELELKGLEDSMQFFRSKGIYEHNVQVAALTEGYGRAVAAGNYTGAREIESKLKVFEEFGGGFVSLNERLWIGRDRMKLLKNRYEHAKVDFESSLPYKFVVERASVPQKKSWPIRWLIVVMSTLSTFFLAIVSIILIEKFSQVVK